MIRRTKNFHRGDVYWVNFNKIFPTSNHYQLGRRPAIIVSNNFNNDNCSNVLIIPCTTKKDNLPQHTYLRMNGKTNYVLPEMLTTIDTSYLEDFLLDYTKKVFYMGRKGIENTVRNI